MSVQVENPFGFVNLPFNFSDGVLAGVTAHQVNVPKVVFSGLICGFGLVGNTAVMFVILVLQEYKKSVTHWYVLQLAIADSLFLLTLPFKMVEDVNGRWIYPEWMCKAKETLLFLNYYASIIFLMVMSLDRYIAVCRPFSTPLQKLRKPVSSMIITAVTWLIALLMCIPIMLYSFKVGQKGSCICTYRFPPTKAGTGPEPHCRKPIVFNINDFGNNLTGTEGFGNNLAGSGSSTDISSEIEMPLFSTVNTTMATQFDFDSAIAPECHYLFRPRGWSVFHVYNFVVMFLIPFLIMVACYGLIIHRLSTTRMKTENMQRNPTPGSSKERKPSSRSDNDRKRITIMCAALVGCFVFCWLPFHAIHMAKIAGIKEKQAVCVTLPIIGSLLAYSNSLLNPFLYGVFGTRFAKRWLSATSTVSKSIRIRTSSSGIGSVRFTKKQSGTKDSSTVNATTETKIDKKVELTSKNQPNTTVTVHSQLIP
uniref:somatostatin receptor type 2-like isoform X2 n=1 Tax=Ciona intestinalis TaxID=7719 RepID=UPI000EF4508F|nr:somatostatin receptor type 2-like isoform X2 [Ciona intestinalis]|eukprot:XP_026695823.1 somatostatin receptor type 2-like isoform X2 [Ciona intestinalis]